MKIQNKPIAYGFLSGLLVLLVGVVATCAGCAASQLHELPSAPARTLSEQSAASVIVITSCGSGTGVLIDSSHVLTAGHVVNCAEWPLVVPPAHIAVRSLAGDLYPVIAVLGYGAHDIARLDILGEVRGINVPRVRAIKSGENICASTAVPKREQRCAVVEATGLPSREAGDVGVSSDNGYWFGNSGSGVYGSDGALVGIVTRLIWCDAVDALLYQTAGIQPSHTCGGRVSSIADSLQVWP